MSKRKRIAKRNQKRQERAESQKGAIRRKYQEMATKRLLGRRELDIYETMRIEVINGYKGNGGCPYLLCEARKEILTREHYNLVTKLYNQMP